MAEKELKDEIREIVDLMIQIDSFKEAISEKKKQIKEEFDIPIITINKVVSIVRKQNLDEEDAKWQEIKELIALCS
jgi:hypothetical protein